jgi:hypothetical protein
MTIMKASNPGGGRAIHARPVRNRSCLFPGSVRNDRLTIARSAVSIRARVREMDDSKVFISSCSRRQMARRRPPRGGVLRMQMMFVLLVLALGVGAFVAGRGGI